MDKPTDAITGNEIDLDEEFFKFKYGLDSDSTDWQEEFPTLKLMDPVAAWITTSPLFDHKALLLMELECEPQLTMSHPLFSSYSLIGSTSAISR